ncbi:MAG: AAA family ATPase [Gemmatimonadetes bacterium]|jgi:MoxR-like ATPase|nr:AAA family ATPase [Gemmatimonadota bacterium]MBT5325878.1 AAA family ATPase [Gemmatimonadota bacterium]MBT5449121.1 AAA family ATPase [Gemmatimonadota bacterium]MBT5804600.1 AAA family ATPase [Gemmatimonadota bacterium]MBT6622813.1 AAA family ATPase [Gemmatimonadota bacterium]
MTQSSIDIHAISERVQQESLVVDRIFQEMDRVIVGQRYMVERLLIGLFCNGHILLEGVPGLAKTLTVSTLAKIVDASFKRIQFTPDLLPADLTGTTIYNQHQGVFIPKKGPVFANLILADEINRAPAKVQSALLECMQERQVTIGDETYRLEDPFLVMATQNPIEQEGTYPLPEAQVDRFMLKVKVDYPTRDEERLILDRMADAGETELARTVGIEEILRLREVVELIYIDDKIKDYVVDLVQATRDPARYGLDEMGPLIEYGASPRATIFLARAARAHAFIQRRGYVTPEDIKAVGGDVLRHRIRTSYEAEAEEIDTEQIVQQLFDHIEVP